MGRTFMQFPSHSVPFPHMLSDIRLIIVRNVQGVEGCPAMTGSLKVLCQQYPRVSFDFFIDFSMIYNSEKQRFTICVFL